MTEEFDFESSRNRFPEHWDDDGRPEIGSTWRSREHPMMRVRVTGRPDPHDIDTCVFWDGDLDGLRLLFTYERIDRWNIASDGLVGLAGAPEHEPLVSERRRARRHRKCALERGMFGGPDTWHIGREGVNLPFFEPVPDWAP